MIENKNEVVPREKFYNRFGVTMFILQQGTIDNFILNFRKYFEEDSRNPKYFHSVRGVRL